MHFLKKCKFPKCTRKGYVAMKENDEFCNLHTNTRIEELKENKNKEE